MSRTQEENMLLEQRIQMMKQKSEELRRRHMEVEADKQSAAKQNALVQMNSPHDDEWIPGRHISPVRNDPRQRRAGEEQSQPRNRSGRGRGNRSDHRHSWNDHSSDDGHINDGESQRYRQTPNYSVVPAIRGRRSGYHNARRSDYEDSNEGKQTGESPYFPSGDHQPVRIPHDGHQGDWANGRHWSSNRGHRNEGLPNTGDNARQGSYPGGPTVTSKVFKNSSIETDHSRDSHARRPVYRLAEGDGPPPDPSYSFLNDAMRDSTDSTDNRRRQPGGNRRGRGFGRGRQTWNDRAPRGEHWNGRSDENIRRNNSEGDSRQLSYEAWRRQRNQIDQERINRQKTSDGNWSREWDSNKVLQEDPSDRPPRWSRGERGGGSRHPRTQRWSREESLHTQDIDLKVKENRDRPVAQDITSNAAQAEGSGEKDGGQQVRRDRRVRQRKPRENRDVEQVSRNLSHKPQRSDQDPPKISLPEGVEDSAVISEVATSETELEERVTHHDAGFPTRRSVEGVGGTLKIIVNSAAECEATGHASQLKAPRKNVREVEGEIKPQRKTLRKGKRLRVSSTASTATNSTPPPPDDEDGSWEDLSSGEEDVSVLAELQVQSKYDLSSSKPSDLSSGPESLDPIPAPGMEDEFLWEEFHPAGFQNNMSLAAETEAALKALLEKQAKEGSKVDIPSDVSEVGSNPPLKFKLDTACLESSSDECEGVQLDPLLVTTQTVQAEVDCMSLTSVATDVSLCDEILSSGKNEDEVKENKIVEGEETKTFLCNQLNSVISAEELSGPMSIVGVEVAAVQFSSSNTDQPPEQSDTTNESLENQLHTKSDSVSNQLGSKEGECLQTTVTSKEIAKTCSVSESKNSSQDICTISLGHSVCPEGKEVTTKEAPETVEAVEELHSKASTGSDCEDGSGPQNISDTLNLKLEPSKGNTDPENAKPNVHEKSHTAKDDTEFLQPHSDVDDTKISQESNVADVSEIAASSKEDEDHCS